ncbi:MAG: PAS domain S-box protein [Burkholderia sp.]|jgi:PAS domain S-box-containing protein|uniref:PAS domain S-box protein n=2 Tax=Burkholderiaceae TaxID=119060 RepID=UPI001CA4576B|nr:MULTISPECIES: PAS domain S-box protein [Burkholderia]MBY8604726.1 PAS domain S-box protein [Burkholderia arboris]MCA3782220.1 PAS domain S-box protein [Burkholderia sp.]MCA3790020.1 PAS domain S-box protein [Burkholderia sp.]MCA3794181.1 PAS domain S-box protein [Burkholderia sp.]MCA3811250.1 PAS domain S-box protein [Burkholderia sp.]
MTVNAPAFKAGPAPRRIRPARYATLAALLTLALGLALSLAAFRLLQNRGQEAAQARFAQSATLATADLRRSLLGAAAVLRGARGFASTLVEPQSGDAWRRYVAGLNLDGLQSPVRSVGRIEPNAADDNQATRRALQRAAETGKVALAANATQDSTDATIARTALMLYLPIYANAEDGASSGTPHVRATGYVYAALDPARLVDPSVLDRLHVDIAADIPAAPVFSGGFGDDDATTARDRLTRTDSLSFGGTPLSLHYSALRADTSGATMAILAAGIALSLILAALVRQVVARQMSAVLPAGDSQPTEARMMGIIRSSMEAVITVDESQTVVIFNPAAERVFGVSAMEAIGAPLSRFIPERFRAAHARHVEQFGVTGVSERQMGRQRVLFGLRGDGSEFPIEASISQIRDGTGKLYTVMLRDVTERVRAENALKQSREELRDLSANLQNVREEEKTRIARELHDDLGQQLTALKMDLSAVELGLAGIVAPNTGVREQLGGMHRLIDSTVASVRRIAADLRPVMLDDLGLVPAIEWLVNDFTHRYRITVDRDIAPADTAFTSAAATTVFRIVQEALTNVARHADATHVKLALKVEDGYCMLRIADNGHGAAETVHDERDRPSFGLIGIRERAHMLDGTVTIDNRPGTGFTITVALPLHTIQQGDVLS